MAGSWVQVDDREMLIMWMTALDEVIGWHGRKELVGLRFKKQEGAWLLVVQVREGKKNLAAFVGGHRPHACLKGFAKLLAGGHIKWFDDKYPP